MAQPFTDDQTARDKILTKLNASDGELSMQALHRFSVLTLARGHQEFSLLMEGLVADELVAFVDGNFQLTDKGREAVSA